MKRYTPSNYLSRRAGVGGGARTGELPGREERQRPKPDAEAARRSVGITPDSGGRATLKGAGRLGCRCRQQVVVVAACDESHGVNSRVVHTSQESSPQLRRFMAGRRRACAERPAEIYFANPALTVSSSQSVDWAGAAAEPRGDSGLRLLDLVAGVPNQSKAPVDVVAAGFLSGCKHWHLATNRPSTNSCYNPEAALTRTSSRASVAHDAHDLSNPILTM
jgi:hypothetical protein